MMKNFFKTLLATLFALCYMFMVSACGAADATGGGGYGDGGYGGGAVMKPEGGGDAGGGYEDAVPDAPEGGMDDVVDEDAVEGEMGEGEGGEGGEEVAPEDSKEESAEEPIKKPAGLITAGAWNDNEYYQAWLDLFSQGDTELDGAAGKFYNRNSEDYSWGFTSLNRIKVTVKDGEKAVAGAHVIAKDAQGNAVFEGVSDANGVAYLFTDEETGTIDVYGGEAVSTLDFTAENRDLAVDFGGFAYAEKKDIIELMFVVDVTGSMGDEISYLNNEIADVVNRVATAYENAQINLALLFYRDHSDKEVFKYYDFVDVTTAEGLAKQQAAIAAQKASGGGDYAEAVEDALALAVGKQWSEGATTKIIFQVLDAPPHSKQSNQKNMREAVLVAAQKGIRVCPVLCSGADNLTEYVMRQAAIYTGGTFVFVTDDSGIGGAHHDPNLPNVVVEKLNSLMVRLINGYHSGEFADPIDWRQDVQE